MASGMPMGGSRRAGAVGPLGYDDLGTGGDGSGTHVLADDMTWVDFTAGPTVTGSDTQVAVIDSGGNLVGDASLTFAGSKLYVGTPANAGRLSVASSGAGTAILNIEGTAANQWFLLVEQGTGGPFFGVGDLDGAFGGGGWTLDDNAGQLVFGDIGYVHGGGVFAFDVPNQKTYQNVDHYFTSDSIGDVYIDRADGVTAYRVFLDTGGGGLQYEAV